MHEKPVLTSFYFFKLATATKVDAIAKHQMPSGKFHCWWSKVEADTILSRYFNCQGILLRSLDLPKHRSHLQWTNRHYPHFWWKGQNIPVTLSSGKVMFSVASVCQLVILSPKGCSMSPLPMMHWTSLYRNPLAPPHPWTSHGLHCTSTPRPGPSPSLAPC